MSGPDDTWWQVTGDRWRLIVILNVHDKMSGGRQESLRKVWKNFFYIFIQNFMTENFCHEMSWNWRRSWARKKVSFRKLNKIIFSQILTARQSVQTSREHPWVLLGSVRRKQLTVDNWLGCRFFYGHECTWNGQNSHPAETDPYVGCWSGHAYLCQTKYWSSGLGPGPGDTINQLKTGNEYLLPSKYQGLHKCFHPHYLFIFIFI